MDTEALQRTWKAVAELGDRVPLRFYSILFYKNPETQIMFPPGMTSQRDKLMRALGTAISNIDQLEEQKPGLWQLGRDHRRFGATQAHYGAVLSALLQTLERSINEWTELEWTEADTDNWCDAFQLLANEMLAAAYEQAKAGIEPWWDAVVSEVERHADVARLRIVMTNPPTGYELEDGHVLDVMPPRRPGLWAKALVRDVAIGAHADLRIRHHGLDFPAMALASTRPGELVRIGPPDSDPFEPEERS
jgi:hemoglobin-like flavoprotein